MTPIPSPGSGAQSPTTCAWRTLSTILGATIVVLSAILAACTADSLPSADGSSAPSASAAATASPIATPEPTPTPATASPEPTPIAEWTGLTWSDPATPSVTIHLTDLVPWGDGYVAGGVASLVDAAGGAAVFLTSADGQHWTVTGSINSGYPGFLTVFDLTILGDELYAFSHPTAEARPDQPLIWRSTDGSEWSAVDPIGWDEAWSDVRGGPLPATWDQTQYAIPTGLVDVASGPDGIVAIGNSIADDGLVPVVLHSTDGQNWSAISLPADPVSPLLNEVVAYDGGFVLVGATHVGADPSTATPATWVSPGGQTWSGATVDVAPVGGAEFGGVVAGDGGLVAWAGAREMHTGPRFTSFWTSIDGLVWSSAETPFSPVDRVSADGTRIVALGPMPNLATDPALWPGISEGWTSTDGSTWSPLDQSRVIDDFSEGMWVVPEGVIYAGAQSFWFGAAQVAE